MQFFLGILFACIALTIPTTFFFKLSISFLWLMAFTSATHDIAADGFYMIGLDEGDQALFNGIRSAFYRVAMLVGQGIFIILVSVLINFTGMEKLTLSVNAIPDAEGTDIKNSFSLSTTEESDEMYLICSDKELNIPLKQVSKFHADSLISVARTWNIAQGQADPNKSKIGENQQKEIKEKKLTYNIFESWLQKNFGVKSEIVSDNTGNLGVVYFHLSKSPNNGKTVIINFGQDKGDKSIKLVEGYRFEFNEKNWNKPVMAVIQLDKSLSTASSAYFDAESGNIKLAWTVLFFCLSGIFFLFWLFHRITIPDVEIEKKEESINKAIKDFLGTFASFFKKEGIGLAIVFLLLFRLGESQLVKLSAPFMLDSREAGGLGLTAGQYGLAYGTIGVLFLTIGGIFGGILVSKHGLKKWIWWFAIMINIPNAVYIYLSYAQPSSLWAIIPCVGFETFGYGFGFTAYMMFMIYISKGEFKTSHYAICTAFMALGMMIPGMISGWLQEIIGYQHFFIWVVIATIPGFILLKFLKFDPKFGLKQK